MERHTADSILDISRKIYEEQEKEFAQTGQRVQYNSSVGSGEQENMLLDDSIR
jgi:hypothetical protein